MKLELGPLRAEPHVRHAQGNPHAVLPGFGEERGAAVAARVLPAQHDTAVGGDSERTPVAKATEREELRLALRSGRFRLSRFRGLSVKVRGVQNEGEDQRPADAVRSH